MTRIPTWITLAVGLIIGSLAGCNGIDINAKIRPSIPGRPDPNEVKPPEPPKPDPYDWEPWWQRPPKK